MKKPTYLERVAEHFQAHPGQWLSCYELERIGGHNGWRTRCSECRRKLGMNISQPKIVKDSQTGVITTFYRYTPPVVSSLRELWESHP